MIQVVNNLCLYALTLTVLIALRIYVVIMIVNYFYNVICNVEFFIVR